MLKIPETRCFRNLDLKAIGSLNPLQRFECVCVCVCVPTITDVTLLKHKFANVQCGTIREKLPSILKRGRLKCFLRGNVLRS